jgi:hypothetical protein
MDHTDPPIVPTPHDAKNKPVPTLQNLLTPQELANLKRESSITIDAFRQRLKDEKSMLEGEAPVSSIGE